jgi:hypothetical protein
MAGRIQFMRETAEFRTLFNQLLAARCGGSKSIPIATFRKYVGECITYAETALTLLAAPIGATTTGRTRSAGKG